MILAVLKSYDENQLANWDAFQLMPYGSFIPKNGLNSNNLKLCYSLLYELTKRFTSEFAIRPFIIEHPEETYSKLSLWCKDKNEHVRRLVSEGTRPRLPWSMKIQKHIDSPEIAMEFLKNLMDDESLYVRKSVANHLNDISKDNPELLIDFLKEYNNKNSANTQWIIKHALRTLVKKGNSSALSILGYRSDVSVELSGFSTIEKKIKLGDYLNFEFTVSHNEKETQPLMIDYVVHHHKSNGTNMPKVFKLKQIDVPKGKSITIKKKHSFKKINTRKYYSGTHSIQIQINGQFFEKLNFELKC